MMLRERDARRRASGAARRARAAIGGVASVCVAFACARGDGRGDAAAGGTSTDVPREPYRVVEASGGGRVAGVVTFDGELPVDTVVRPISDTDVCGERVVQPGVRRGGRGVEGVVVWIEIRAGKPLPLARRYELLHERCLLTPRVQAVVTGGTLNLRSADALTHRTRFVRLATDATIETVTETEQGQVVPLERLLATPERIEVRCDQHPWTRAWLAVFDHPYAQVTTERGTFAMDSVPAGRYRIVAWHERLGRVEDSVTVAAGGEVTVELKLRGMRDEGRGSSLQAKDE